MQKDPRPGIRKQTSTGQEDKSYMKYIGPCPTLLDAFLHTCFPSISLPASLHFSTTVDGFMKKMHVIQTRKSFFICPLPLLSQNSCHGFTNSVAIHLVTTTIFPHVLYTFFMSNIYIKTSMRIIHKHWYQLTFFYGRSPWWRHLQCFKS